MYHVVFIKQRDEVLMYGHIKNSRFPPLPYTYATQENAVQSSMH
jgi:hypothetical protein